MEYQEQPSMLKSSMNTGAILGLVLIVVTLAQSVLEMYGSMIFQYLSYLILIAGIILAVKYYRDKMLGGYISYGQVVGFGTLTALFAGILSAFLLYLYLKFVDDSMIAFIFEKAEQDLYAKNVPDEQIEVALSSMKMFNSPGMVAVFGVIGNVFFGLIVSLIAGIFMKNEQEELPNV